MKRSIFVAAVIVGLVCGTGLYAEASTVHVPCSVAALRSAITTANTSGGTLKLKQHCTYSFTDVSSSAGDALPAITGHVTIIGNGARLVRRTTTQFRIFDVRSGAEVRISGLSIRNGHAPDATTAAAGANGGGILNAGTLTLRHVAVVGNVGGAGGTQVAVQGFAGGSGGGISNSGALTLVRSRVVRNVTGIGGGGVAILIGGNGGNGGGIDNEGTLVVRSSSVSGNQTGIGGSATPTPGVGGSGAGIYNGSTHSAAIARSVITRNQTAAGGNGGGIFNAATTTITPRHTTITHNKPNNCAPAGTVAHCHN